MQDEYKEIKWCKADLIALIKHEETKINLHEYTVCLCCFEFNQAAIKDYKNFGVYAVANRVNVCRSCFTILSKTYGTKYIYKALEKYSKNIKNGLIKLIEKEK